MLKIGDFSMLSKISINMLRHYDEIELLTPAHIDESTGYRYYHEEQLPTANRIQALKGMGMSLAMIKQIINTYDDIKSLKNYLQIQLSHKNEDLAALAKQILLLNTAIKNLDEDTNFTKFNIAVKEIPKRIVISYRKKISSYDKEGILWIEMEQKTKHLNIQYTSLDYDIAIVHNHTDAQSDIDV